MKYIVIDREKVAVFSDLFTHSEFKPMGNITSAGFVVIGEDHGKCDTTCTIWGESVSLGVKSDQELDEKLINRMLTRY
jgi:hypothetical protein